MPDSSIFQHASFFTLDNAQKIRVRDYALAGKFTTIDTHEIFQYQTDLLLSLEFWDNKINVLKQFATRSEDFNSMSHELLSMLQDELLFALYIFCARYQLDMAQGYGDVLDDHGSQIKKCNQLINMINQEAGPVLESHVTDNLPIVEDDRVNEALDWIRAFNERRLYWVWAGRGGFLGSATDLLPDDFFNKEQALAILDIPVPFTGFLSWGLYYFRFLVRVGILFRHTISGLWMSTEEQSIPWQARFWVHLNKIKFDLLNDFFWASGNLACFYWLYGSLDFYGGVLTIALLLMDVSIAIWGYSDDFVQYESDMARLKADVCKLEASKAPISQVNALKHAQRQCKLEWDYKLYALYTDMVYAVSLCLAFGMLYGFFLPIALPASTLVGLAVAGTMACFTLNAVFSGMRQGLDVCKSIELSNYAAQDYSNKLNSTPHLKTTREGHFELTLLESEYVYHQKIIEYKQVCLLRNVIIDFTVPPVVFLALVFMPLSMGLSVILAGLVFAVASHYHVEINYEHEMTCLPEYSHAAMPASEQIIPQVRTHGFFAKVTNYLHDQREPAINITSSSSNFCLLAAQ